MNRRDFIRGIGASALSVAVIANSEHPRPYVTELRQDATPIDVVTAEYPEDLIIDLSKVDSFSLDNIADTVPTMGGSHPIRTRERVAVEMRAPHQVMLDWLHNAGDIRQSVRVVYKTLDDGHGNVRAISFDSQAHNAVTIVDFPAVILSATVTVPGAEMPPMLTMDLERVYG